MLHIQGTKPCEQLELGIMPSVEDAAVLIRGFDGLEWTLLWRQGRTWGLVLTSSPGVEGYSAQLPLTAKLL